MAELCSFLSSTCSTSHFPVISLIKSLVSALTKMEKSLASRWKTSDVFSGGGKQTCGGMTVVAEAWSYLLAKATLLEHKRIQRKHA